jgi:hypothetical protein
MAGKQIIKYTFAFLCAGILFSWPTRICLCQTQQNAEKTTEVGELKLEGKNIQRLVLQRKNGNQETFKQPGESISLPPGEYQLYEVRLQGGYICDERGDQNAPLVTVTSDKPAVLKIGAPLRQTIKVERQGGVLILNYKLLGIGDENYSFENVSKPPIFTVYKADKEIASGKFEFG